MMSCSGGVELMIGCSGGVDPSGPQRSPPPDTAIFAHFAPPPVDRYVRKLASLKQCSHICRYAHKMGENHLSSGRGLRCGPLGILRCGMQLVSGRECVGGDLEAGSVLAGSQKMEWVGRGRSNPHGGFIAWNELKFPTRIC